MWRDASRDEASARDIAEVIQKIYLGVGIVLSADEAREIVNRFGANLTGSLPVKTPAAPVMPVEVPA